MGENIMADFITTTGIEQAIQGFQTSMLVGFIRIALTLIIAAIAMIKAGNQYGTSSKVVTWSFAALAAMVVWMV